MWEKIYEFLFNPNHDFSVKTFIIITVVSLFLTYFARWLATRRRQRREGNNSAAANPNIRRKQAPKKKNNKKRKK